MNISFLSTLIPSVCLAWSIYFFMNQEPIQTVFEKEKKKKKKWTLPFMSAQDKTVSNVSVIKAREKRAGNKYKNIFIQI